MSGTSIIAQFSMPLRCLFFFNLVVILLNGAKSFAQFWAIYYGEHLREIILNVEQWFTRFTSSKVFLYSL